jgi:predicted thioesterase
MEWLVKPTLTQGISTKRRYRIDRERTIDFMGEQARVYATPMLVRDIEVTCREFLLQHLDAGEDSVGTRVEIDHLAATLLGMEVEVSVSVAEVKGRGITFAVEAHDGVDAVCRGKHMRFVVDVKQTEMRLAAKAQKAREQGKLA